MDAGVMDADVVNLEIIGLQIVTTLSFKLVQVNCNSKA